MAEHGTQGTLLKLGGTTVAQRVRINPNDNTRNKIETTDLDDTAETSIPGIMRGGELELEVNYDAGVATHASLWSAYENKTVGSWSLVLQDSGSATFDFSGWISSFKPGEAAVDGLQRATIKITVSGTVTLTP